MSTILEFNSPITGTKASKKSDSNVADFVLPPKAQAIQKQQKRSTLSRLQAMDDTLFKFKFAVDEYKHCTPDDLACVIYGIEQSITNIMADLEILKMNYRAMTEGASFRKE